MTKLFRERVAEARAEGFTPSFCKVTEYIEANVLRAALSTASAVARENGVDPATVVRMTQRLGSLAPHCVQCSAGDRGWPELREELAAGIVEGTDVVTGTELIPLLQGHREALETERGALQGGGGDAGRRDRLDRQGHRAVCGGGVGRENA